MHIVSVLKYCFYSQKKKVIATQLPASPLEGDKGPTLIKKRRKKIFLQLASTFVGDSHSKKANSPSSPSRNDDVLKCSALKQPNITFNRSELNGKKVGRRR